MRGTWREVREELVGLMLPADCAGCGLPRVRGRLCHECGSALTGSVPRRVWPSPVPSGLPPVYGATTYADEVRAVLLSHKERGALGLVAPLGSALAAAVRMAAAVPPAAGQGRRGPARARSAGSGTRRPLTLVPVPSGRGAVAGRGHDPVRRIARAAARELRRDVPPVRVLPVLRQRRSVMDQAGLTGDQRWANLNGALEAARGSGRWLRESWTVLVDDVVTTGASLTEAARALAEEGVHVVGAAVVASRSGP